VVLLELLSPTQQHNATTDLKAGRDHPQVAGGRARWPVRGYARRPSSAPGLPYCAFRPSAASATTSEASARMVRTALGKRGGRRVFHPLGEECQTIGLLAGAVARGQVSRRGSILRAEAQSAMTPKRFARWRRCSNRRRSL
jgi:hypothetical protein